MYKIINTNTNISTFIGNKDAVEGQGQGFLINDVDDYNENRHNSDYELPIDTMKRLYDKNWDLDKPVLCDRSPPYVHFAKQIETHFEQFGTVYFITMMRNPYTTRWVSGCDWTVFATEQRDNINDLKNVCNISYEELVQNPTNVQEKLNDFMPDIFEMDSLDFNVGQIEHFNIHDKRCNPMTDKYVNEVKDVTIKNETLVDHKDLLEFFGYKYMG